jgi:tetratricopeptide (TPR) repeat protein
MRVVRLFVSSPGDVEHERRRVERVAERLNSEFAAVARIETIRWERHYYGAHATFQSQIPEAAECDVVIAVFWSRLGSELPPDFPPMPDGEPYPSGTAYEVLTAIQARKSRALPDIFVFRKTARPQFTIDDDHALEQARMQWGSLKAFFERWFVTAQGHFRAAFHEFQTADELETKTEELLRGWLEERVLHGRSVPWPIGLKGSPFRGLEHFDTEHTAVFFGRSRDVARAIDAFKTASERNMPFLLVVGASGAGKSSLVRAGLVPRLTASGVVREVDVWRVAIMRPGLRPIRAFAEALLATPSEAETAMAALPELTEGDFRTPAELAAQLEAGGDMALRPIERALARVAEGERVRAGFERPIRAQLLLVIDQLDDLFGPDVTAAERTAFARLLRGLIATGRIWIVATLRGALYEKFLNEPDLKAMKDSGAHHDLAPPGAVELADIVRKPAEAAALTFEPDTSGEPLDERILRDAAGADTLPLLQFTLQRLFEERVTDGGKTLLTQAAYAELGGIDGAIDNGAERAASILGEAEKAALPRLLRKLATPLDGGALTIQSASLAEATSDNASRRLVDVLVAARILLVETESGVPALRLTHQRVLESWRRARDIISGNADFFRIRGEVENQHRRWLGSKSRPELLIPRGLPLAEAEKIVDLHGDELNASIKSFIAASGRRARLSQRLTAAAAVVFAMLTVGASILGIYALRSERRAEQQFARAEKTNGAVKLAFDQLLSELLDQLNGKSKREIATTLQLALETAKQTLGVASDPNDLESQAHLAGVIRKVHAMRSLYLDPKGALSAGEEIIAISRKLVAADPANTGWLSQLGRDLSTLAVSRSSLNDEAGADSAYRESGAIARKLTELDPLNLEWQSDLAKVLDTTAGRLKKAGNLAGALVNAQEALAIATKLRIADPANTDWNYQLSSSAFAVTDLQEETGDKAASLATTKELVALLRTQVTSNETAQPNDQAKLAHWLGRFAHGIEKTDPQGAIAALAESISILRKLPRDRWDRLDDALSNIARLYLVTDKREAASSVLQELLLSARRALARAPDDADLQMALVGRLIDLADVVDRADARVALLEALNIVEAQEREGKLEKEFVAEIVRDKLATFQ